MRVSYGVYPHSERGLRTGRGFVVRPAASDGLAIDQHHYRGIGAIRVFASVAAAERCAERSNRESTLAAEGGGAK